MSLSQTIKVTSSLTLDHGEKHVDQEATWMSHLNRPKKQRQPLSSLFPHSSLPCSNPVKTKMDVSTMTLPVKNVSHSHTACESEMDDKTAPETPFLRNKFSTLKRLTKRESGFFARSPTSDIVHIQVTHSTSPSSDDKLLKVDVETQTVETSFKKSTLIPTLTSQKIKQFATLSKQRSMLMLNSWRHGPTSATEAASDQVESIPIQPKTLSKRKSMFVLKSWQPKEKSDLLASNQAESTESQKPNSSYSTLGKFHPFRTLTRKQSRSVLSLFDSPPVKTDSALGSDSLHQDSAVASKNDKKTLKMKYLTLSKRRSHLVLNNIQESDKHQIAADEKNDAQHSIDQEKLDTSILKGFDASKVTQVDTVHQSIKESPTTNEISLQRAETETLNSTESVHEHAGDTSNTETVIEEPTDHVTQDHSKQLDEKAAPHLPDQPTLSPPATLSKRQSRYMGQFVKLFSKSGVETASDTIETKE